MYVCMYICSQKDRQCAPRLLPISQWPHDNSCTWADDVQLHIAGTNEPKSAQQVKQGAKQHWLEVVKKTDNVPSRLLPIRQWPHVNSSTWAHDVRLHIASTNEPKSAQHAKQRAKQIWLEVKAELLSKERYIS